MQAEERYGHEGYKYVGNATYVSHISRYSSTNYSTDSCGRWVHLNSFRSPLVTTRQAPSLGLTNLHLHHRPTAQWLNFCSFMPWANR